MRSWDLKGLQPRQCLIAGSFVPSIVAAKASLDLDTVTSNVDTVIQAASSGSSGNDITFKLVGDSPGAKASLDCSTLTTNSENVFDKHEVGTAGNDWAVSLSGTSNSGVSVAVDTNGKHVIIQYEDGVSTETHVATGVNALAGVNDVIDDNSSVDDTVLDASADYFVAQSLSGGQDDHYIEVSGNDVVVHFTPGTTTVADVENLISGLTGDEAIIEVATSGTGANTLGSGDGIAAQSLSGGLDDGAPTSVRGDGFTVTRTDTGVYTVTVANQWSSMLACRANIELDTATDQWVSVGSYNTTNRTFTLSIMDNSEGGLTDPSTSDRIHFLAIMNAIS